MDLHGIRMIKEKWTVGSRSRYLGQIVAIRDFAKYGKPQEEVDIQDNPQQMVDEIIESGGRFVHLLRDVVKFQDFDRIENVRESIDDETLVSWYERQWWQMGYNLMAYNAVPLFGGKQELADAIGISYNTVNSWVSFRTLISHPDVMAAFDNTKGITNKDEFAKIWRETIDSKVCDTGKSGTIPEL